MFSFLTSVYQLDPSSCLFCEKKVWIVLIPQLLALVALALSVECLGYLGITGAALAALIAAFAMCVFQLVVNYAFLKQNISIFFRKYICVSFFTLCAALSSWFIDIHASIGTVLLMICQCLTLSLLMIYVFPRRSETLHVIRAWLAK